MHIGKHWNTIAGRQHGLITRPQLAAHDVTPRQIDRLLGVGDLVVVHRGVYRLGGVGPSFEQRTLAACLATGATASHRCAAALWELRACEPRVVEITVVGRRQPALRGVAAHEMGALPLGQVTELRSIPVSTPGRTLLDLGMVVNREVVESALEDALHRGLVSARWLERVLGRSGGPGRDGTAMLRSLLNERAPGQKATESDLEDLLVRVLRRAGLPAPVRQYVFGTLRIDLCYPPPHCLVLEAQSMKWHAGRADLQRDCDKRNLLVEAGWRVLVFTWDDVRRRPEWVVHVVRSALGSGGAVPLGA